jgi:hypothetical protein
MLIWQTAIWRENLSINENQKQKVRWTIFSLISNPFFCTLFVLNAILSLIRKEGSVFPRLIADQLGFHEYGI